MPQKYTIKTYIKDGYYHVYNRGVEKRIIYLDEQDFTFFLYLLKYYLSPQKIESHPSEEDLFPTQVRPRPLSNIGKEIDLLAFCLMPNHFHLLVKQQTILGMQKLMRRILTTYVMYFNKKYNRVGSLFQGPYKAALIDTDEYLLHLSRYIHLNPNDMTRRTPVTYPYSSYPYYLKLKTAMWLNTQPILSYFNSPTAIPLSLIRKRRLTYQKFVEDQEQNSIDILGSLTLEN